MDVYEIYILKRGSAPVILASTHASDHAAVRRARSLSALDDKVQVWRGASCIYSTSGDGSESVHSI